MATRENQGLQIALIASVILVVFLAVLSYYFWSQFSEARTARDAMESRLNTAMGEQRTTLTEYNQVKTWLGLTGDTQLPEINSSYQNALTLFGDNWPAEKRGLFDLIDYLVSEIQTRNTQLSEAHSAQEDLRAEKDTVKQRETKRSKEYEDAQKAAADDLQVVRESTGREIERTNSEKGQIAGDLQKKDDELAKLTTQSEKAIDKLDKQLRFLQLDNERLQSTIDNMSTVNTNSPHGKIVMINQRKRVAYLDLGTEHGLRPQITFTVFNEDESTLEENVVKGSVEVIRVINERLSEARIVDEDISDLMVPGDKIWSPVWKPGSRLRFALVGTFDTDGDGKSDLRQLRNLITLNGGLIDAETDEDGNVTGQVSLETRYLVMGDAPNEESGDAVQTSWEKLTTDANRYSVEPIGVDELLRLMGWHHTGQAEQIGKSRRVDLSDKKGSEFRERRPPAAE